jgi:cobalt/nickel transport system permease protein
LPGGTTGHAIGVGIAAVVLGPWASILAISVALVIQALFFGDGGITAIGANCFNMAIAGSLVAYTVYKLIAARSSLVSSRRVIAAGLAGYLACNAAALLAAIEFGIQPALYRDASGAPLYCPYPLHIAIPAMMIGHITVAGLAELFVSAGLVVFLQRLDPQLLNFNSVPRAKGPTQSASATGLRPLWIGLALLMTLTPLGFLAAGSAWGEWVASDYADPAVRSQMAAASFRTPPPSAPPQGLARLSTLWTAPFARYAPPYLTSPVFGYILSALFGVGIVILVSFGLTRMVPRRSAGHASTE